MKLIIRSVVVEAGGASLSLANKKETSTDEQQQYDRIRATHYGPTQRQLSPLTTRHQKHLCRGTVATWREMLFGPMLQSDCRYLCLSSLLIKLCSEHALSLYLSPSLSLSPYLSLYLSPSPFLSISIYTYQCAAPWWQQRTTMAKFNRCTTSS